MGYNTFMPTNGPKEKILIIESDATFGTQISSALQQKGYVTILSKNGQEGVRAIQENLPHLIVLDASLSGEDSYAILTHKQSEPLLTKIPVFLVSNQVTPIDMTRVPPGSVKEFIVALHMNPAEIVNKADALFGHIESIPQRSIPGDNKKKVLWVEDDKLIGTILAKKMMSSGFDLFHAKNGEEALDVIKETVPNAIVLDLVLPNMNGFDILEQIRKDARMAKVPVMILSNLSKQSDIERSKALGAQKFLVKAAASLDQIIAEVRALCN